MKEDFNYADLLVRYFNNVCRRNRGDPMLDEYSGLNYAERAAIKRLANPRGTGTGSSTFERVGGEPPPEPGHLRSKY
jgi:hypothetical protein